MIHVTMVTTCIKQHHYLQTLLTELRSMSANRGVISYTQSPGEFGLYNIICIVYYFLLLEYIQKVGQQLQLDDEIRLVSVCLVIN